MQFNLLHLEWWGYVLFTLAFTHITIAAVTIFLHRHQSHHSLELHPITSHFFRFWLWLTTGIVTKEWVAIHRKHHVKVESPEDPHSPNVYGIRSVLFGGYELYRKEGRNNATLETYGNGTPDDWVERNIYAKRHYLGIGSMLLLDVLLFGPIGITVWAVQMLWIPFFRRRRHQWRWALLGLSQFCDERHFAQYLELGRIGRRRRVAQQPPCL